MSRHEHLYGMSRVACTQWSSSATETDSNACIFGRVRDSVMFARIGNAVRTVEFVVEEELCLVDTASALPDP